MIFIHNYNKINNFIFLYEKHIILLATTHIQ